MAIVEVTVKRPTIEVQVKKTSVDVGIIKGEVSSVAGKTGAVELEINDIQDLRNELDSIVAGADKTYTHNQILASTSWNVVHNLNKFPSVTVIDSGDTVVVGDITYINSNQLTISFSFAFSGKAILN